MTPTSSAVTRESFAEGLMHAFSVLRTLADVAWDLGEEATALTEITVPVGSEAEVDAVAAAFGVTPERPAPGHYRAVSHEGPVTVTVACGTAGSTS